LFATVESGLSIGYYLLWQKHNALAQQYRTGSIKNKSTTYKEQVTMGNEFTMTTGQAHEVAQAFGRNGWENGQVKKLSEGDFLKSVLDVLLGRAEIKPIGHVVDFGADPFLSNGWTVEEHQAGKIAKLERNGDDLYLDGKKIEFWFSECQKGDKVIGGHDLRKEVSKQPVLNANLLDHLLKHPHLIPETWKKDENGNTRYIFFWGTVYRNSDGRLYVRCLDWRDGGWCSRYLWLDLDWRSGCPAAVSAS
jgi:hypothetical protein